jgi:hypothetical protein
MILPDLVSDDDLPDLVVSDDDLPDLGPLTIDTDDDMPGLGSVSSDRSDDDDNDDPVRAPMIRGLSDAANPPATGLLDHPHDGAHRRAAMIWLARNN